MATKGYNLEQTGEQVQAALNKAINLGPATEEADGLMTAADKASLENLNTEINDKVDKVTGKGLSTNDFTNEDKSKLDTAYQVPSTGIPAADMSSGVQTALNKANSAVQPADLVPITEKIPAQASAQNQLADKAFVNSSISTASADFKGTYDSLAELQAVTADKNDYGYVVSTDEAGNTVYSRYKYNGSSWVFEYDLNNSSFTAAEWAAIQSGITTPLVQKLGALPTNADLQSALSGKQATLVSGTNIKTVDGQSILGSGNLSVSDPNAVKVTAQTWTDAQKTQARTNIGAYAKPSGGIPKTDLDSGVQGSLDLADSAIQARPSGEVDPAITPAEYATQEELAQLEAKVTDLGEYVTNPEWIRVITDNDGNVLCGIKVDGSIDWGIGVPKPVKDYVAEQVSIILSGGEGTSINDIEKIIDFLVGFSTSDTLSALLNTKEDKVAGKSLIDSEFASSQEAITNSEWIQVTTDNEGKVIEGIRKDGKRKFFCGIDGLSDEDIRKIVVDTGKKWIGKKWVVVGDSLTQANDKATKRYYDYVKDETGITVHNMGVAGTGYKRDYENNRAFYQRIGNVPIDADVVTIFGSFNDYPYIADELGEPTDTGTTTLGGCINTTLDNLFTAYPLAVVGVVSPTPWEVARPGVTLAENYVKLLHDICELRGIPYFDLFHCSGLRPWEASYRALCYSRDNGGGTHPDETGHKLIAPRFSEFLNMLITF